MYKYLITSLFLLVSLITFAQNGKVKGRVYNQKNNEPLEFATVQIQGTVIGATVVATHEPSGTTYGTVTNRDGRYNLPGESFEKCVKFLFRCIFLFFFFIFKLFSSLYLNIYRFAPIKRLHIVFYPHFYAFLSELDTIIPGARFRL